MSARELYYLAFSMERGGYWNEDRIDDIRQQVRNIIICGQLDNDNSTDRLLEWFSV